MIPHDTSNSELKSEFLPPLQKRIIVFLAKKPPMNKHATAKAMNEHTRSTWLSFQSLENNGLIKKIDRRMSLGRERDCYWLTDSGIFLALIEGAKPKNVLRRTKEIYPENKLLQCVIEITAILGTSMHKVAYSAVSTKGKLEQDDRSAIMSAQLQKELSLEQIQELMAIMRKYPEQVGDMQEKIMEMIDKIKKVESFLKEANEQTNPST
jgi:DNA-binding MarR family transcriptional regulator